jgi:tetratricopeptide (TPR) repeat protein
MNSGAPPERVSDAGVDAQNPWPGLAAFTEEQSEFFHGRDEETDELLRGVKGANLTVLFGQSGLGKSSLLHAGLFPRLRAEGFLPVSIRLDHSTDAPALTGQVISAVARAVAAAGGNPAAAEWQPAETLWEHFHRRSLVLATAGGRPALLVLVFDQFEELFAKGQAAGEARARTARFLTELADLAEGRPPKALEDRLPEHPDLAKQFVFRGRDYNMVICLREDYLAHLEGLKGSMPSIAENRMQLWRMSGARALEAVLIPAGGLIAPDVARQVVRFVAGAPLRPAGDAGTSALDDGLADLEVEPSLLSLVCRELNNRRIEQRLPQITADLLLGKRDEILRDYYERSMADQPPAVRAFVEDDLLDEAGRRDNMAVERARRALTLSGVTSPAIDELVRRRLLHIEDRLGLQRVELTHDVLTAVVKQSRDDRREREKAQAERLAAEQAAQRQTEQAELQARLERERAERAAQRVRRLRAALIASLAALAIAGGLGAFAFFQWRRAETLKREADQARATAVEARRIADLARQAADDSAARAGESERNAKANAESAIRQSKLSLATLNAMIFDIQRSMENLSGSSPIRRRLLATALARLEQLSGEFVEQSTVDRNTAVVMLDMGELVLQFGMFTDDRKTSGAPDPSSSIGAAEAAVRLYTRSLAILEALAKADPNNAEAKRDLSVSYEKFGDVHLQLGATVKALGAYEKGLELSATLAKAHPNDPVAKRDLYVWYNKLGDVHLKLGATDKALQRYRNGLELSEALAKAYPNAALAKRDLSVSYNRLGDVHLRLGATNKALAAYRNGLELSETLAKAEPNNAQAKRDLAVSYNKLGDVHLQLGATDKALEAYQKGLDVSQTLAKAEPNSAQAKRDLSISYDNLGDVHLKLGATDKALEAYKEARELREALAKVDPNNVQAKRDLSISYEKLGDVHLKLGATDEALDAYQKDLELCQTLARADSNDAEAKRDLSIAYEKLGNVHLLLAAADKALEAYQKSLELRETLAKADPANAQAAQDVSESFSKMGQASERSSKPAEARRWYEKRLAADRALSERLPENAVARREVATDYDLLQGVCARAGDWSSAVSYARQAIEHARAAQRIAFARQPFAWDFSISYRNLGNAQLGAGQAKEARQSYEEAVKEGLRSAVAHGSLARLLATSWDETARDGKRAVQVATKACELSEWKEPNHLDTLAAAHAEAGQFEEAVKWEKKAIELAKDEKLKGEFGSRLKLYEGRKAYRQPRPGAPAPGNADRGRPE